jgi:hypothetical protein
VSFYLESSVDVMSTLTGFSEFLSKKLFRTLINRSGGDYSSQVILRPHTIKNFLTVYKDCSILHCKNDSSMFRRR